MCDACLVVCVCVLILFMCDFVCLIWGFLYVCVYVMFGCFDLVFKICVCEGFQSVYVCVYLVCI